MSNDASTWAWSRVVGSPSGKLVLVVLADFANARGECFPSIPLLAKRTEQSVDTVRRRLGELEAEGLIERVEQFKPNGTRTSNLFRLLMDGPAGALADSERSGTPADCQGTPKECEGTLADCGGDPSTGARVTLATVRGYVEPPIEPSMEPTPHSPPAGGKASGDPIKRGGEPDGTQLDTIISELMAADPKMIVDRPQARRQWAKLDPTERAKALAGVSRYVDRWRSAGQRFQLRTPHGYLKGRIWTDMALAPADKPMERPAMDARSRAVAWARSDASRDGWVFVPADSEAWAAWDQAFRDEGRRLPPATLAMAPAPGGGFTKQLGRSFPMERPPPRGAPAADAQAAE